MTLYLCKMALLSALLGGAARCGVRAFSVAGPRRAVPSASRHHYLQRRQPDRSLATRQLATTTQLSDSTVIGTPPTSFDDGQRPFEITTPIYYVNDKPHIGHAYTSTACDVIARFMRLSGREVFFLSGTDEHGQKVEMSAEKQGLAPQDFVDAVSVNFRDLLDLLNISIDKFIRTTEEQHKKSVQVRRSCVHGMYVIAQETSF